MCVGSDGLHVVYSLIFDAKEDERDMDKVITTFDNYCI